MKEKARVMVTGGAGFIGSHLCDALISGGYRVVCLDSLSTGDRSNIEGLLGNPSFSFVEADVVDPLDPGNPDCEVGHIFHLASPASPADYMADPIGTLRANSVGTYNCLDLAVKVGARMLMGSTSEVYGDPRESPQSEEYFGHVNPVGPRSCYDEAKRFAEALCKAFERVHGAEVVVIRIFNTYGSRMRRNDGRAIPNMVCQALDGEPLTVYGEGSQTRSFCHVKDMVRGLMLAMFTPEAAGEVINLGNPNEMRIIDLARVIREKVGSSSSMAFEPLPEDDPQRRQPDITRAMELLGWAPEVDIESGLEDVIRWFREKR